MRPPTLFGCFFERKIAHCKIAAHRQEALGHSEISPCCIEGNSTNPRSIAAACCQCWCWCWLLLAPADGVCSFPTRRPSEGAVDINRWVCQLGLRVITYTVTSKHVRGSRQHLHITRKKRTTGESGSSCRGGRGCCSGALASVNTHPPTHTHARAHTHMIRAIRQGMHRTCKC